MLAVKCSFGNLTILGKSTNIDLLIFCTSMFVGSCMFLNLAGNTKRRKQVPKSIDVSWSFHTFPCVVSPTAMLVAFWGLFPSSMLVFDFYSKRNVKSRVSTQGQLAQANLPQSFHYLLYPWFLVGCVCMVPYLL